MPTGLSDSDGLSDSVDFAAHYHGILRAFTLRSSTLVTLRR
jgi:hypothetical protein